MLAPKPSKATLAALASSAVLASSANATYIATFQKFDNSSCSGDPSLIATYLNGLGASMCGLIQNSTTNSTSVDVRLSQFGLTDVANCTAQSDGNNTFSVASFCLDYSRSLNDSQIPSYANGGNGYVRFRYFPGNECLAPANDSSSFSLEMKQDTCISNDNLGGVGAISGGFITAKCGKDTVELQTCSDSECSQNCQTQVYGKSQCRAVNGQSFPPALVSMFGDNATDVYYEAFCNYWANSANGGVSKLPLVATFALAVAGAAATLIF